eukprot:3050031-Amphidinium_carterae.1
MQRLKSIHETGHVSAKEMQTIEEECVCNRGVPRVLHFLQQWQFSSPMVPHALLHLLDMALSGASSWARSGLKESPQRCAIDFIMRAR